MPSTVLTDPAETTAHVAAPRPSRTAVLRACGCGQDLDTCRAGHCPRCGVTLHA